MYVYIFADLVMLAFVFMSRHASIKRCNLMLGISCAMWALIFGLRRYDVGNDTPSYAGFFECTNVPWSGYGTYNAPGETIEYGYVLINKILALFSTSATFFFLFHGVFLFSLLYYLYKDRRNSVMSLLWTMTFGAMIVTLMVATRQSFAMCFALLGFLLLMKSVRYDDITHLSILHYKKFFIGIIAFIFSIFVHRSFFLLFPIIVLSFFFRLNKVSAYIILSVAFIIGIFDKGIISNLFDFVVFLVAGVDDYKIALLADRYGDNMSYAGSSIIRLISLAVPIYITIHYTKEDIVNTFPCKCLIYGLACYFLFSSSPIISRIVAIYIVMGYSIVIPKIVNRYRKLYFIYFLITLYYLWRIIAGYEQDMHTMQNTYIDYHFVWE